ncbi:hypothetical protein F511_27569 [Dorcoceras hygrometricum]|uniref:Uncharacterized protein n=1 Tax=Dorcoceras hygrometricum TaxID=472368 RepID=A0A2Z7ATH9_9LAMI|nr:hypothetical protein F511_27569 [Dorcoceras hygrometricum]
MIFLAPAVHCSYDISLASAVCSTDIPLTSELTNPISLTSVYADDVVLKEENVQILRFMANITDSPYWKGAQLFKPFHIGSEQQSPFDCYQLGDLSRRVGGARRNFSVREFMR